MIVDFTVQNFRSFHHEQLFSMNVSRGKSVLPENYIVDGKLSVLKTAAVYGANASGKSNLLLALLALRWMIADSGDLKEDESIPAYEPFKLSTDATNKPVNLSIEFIVKNHGRFYYELSYLHDRIVEEKLHSLGRQKAVVFERNENDTWETIKFGGTYRGGNRKIPFFGNNSYLSKAGNNAGTPDMVRAIYRYFRRMSHLERGERIFAATYLKDIKKLSNVAGVLAAIDTGISKITVKENGEAQTPIPDDMPEYLRRIVSDEQRFSFSFWHKDSDGVLVEFASDEESAGTQRLFNLLPVFVEALRKGEIVLLDEIEDSFHPHIVRLIIRLFNDPRININGAQLIFTTHNTAILESTVLRKDQIWFVEKNEGSSTLHSLDEYDSRTVRPNSPYSDWYDEGRFGAVPAIRYNAIVEIVEKVVHESADN